jgi:hypothetical protein
MRPLAARRHSSEPQARSLLPRGERPMTVCIAAMCVWGERNQMVVGASDRMLSAIDIQFEPPQTKIIQFLPSIIGLVAVDPYAQMSICRATAEHIRYSRKPITTVEQVAVVYAEIFSKHRRERAETKIFEATWIGRQFAHGSAAEFQAGGRFKFDAPDGGRKNRRGSDNYRTRSRRKSPHFRYQ